MSLYENPKNAVRAWEVLDSEARKHLENARQAEHDAANYQDLANRATNAAEYHHRAAEECRSAAGELKTLAGKAQS